MPEFETRFDETHDAAEASFFMPEMSDDEVESSFRRQQRVLGLFAAVEAAKQGSGIIGE